jgi:hypothetical protein
MYRKESKYALGGMAIQPYRQPVYKEVGVAGIGDWVDTIKNKLKNVGAKGLELVDKIGKELKDRGTTVLTGTNYSGPGNSISPEYIASHPPKNIIDEGALEHDQTYSDIAKRRDAGEITKEQADKEIRESDEKFLKNIRNNYTKDPWASLLSYAGIWSKVVAEDVAGLDRNKFVTQKRGGFAR